MESLLTLNKLSMNFGGIKAVDEATLQVDSGKITALIGPNGAGKTTVFNCVTGVYAPVSGKATAFPPNQKAGITINKLRSDQITRIGLARTFQNIRLFANMTVLENVMVSRNKFLTSNLFSSILRTRSQKKEEERLVSDCYAFLEKIGLEKYVNEIARNLPYGEQRRLEIARALATEPFLLLLDEPAAGMNPRETVALEGLIDKIRREEKVAVFLIEHDMRLVMRISDLIYVMDSGRVIARGKPEEIKKNPEVIKAYLGDEIHA